MTEAVKIREAAFEACQRIAGSPTVRRDVDVLRRYLQHVLMEVAHPGSEACALILQNGRRNFCRDILIMFEDAELNAARSSTSTSPVAGLVFPGESRAGRDTRIRSGGPRRFAAAADRPDAPDTPEPA